MVGDRLFLKNIMYYDNVICAIQNWVYFGHGDIKRIDYQEEILDRRQYAR